MSATRTKIIVLTAAAVWACQGGSPEVAARQTHSGPITISPDGSLVYVVHPDADVVSAVDTSSHTIAFEAPLGATPSQDGATGTFSPGVMPRGLTLDPSGATLFVTGQRTGRVYALDARTGRAKATSSVVCAEPTGIVMDEAGANLFVACSNDDSIAQLRASDLARVALVACPRKPWALSWASDGKTLYATHLLGSGITPTPETAPAVSVFATGPLALRTSWPLLDSALSSDPTVPNGEARGLYDAAVRPGTTELWVLHAMLAASTPEPALDFQTTVFPTISILGSDGTVGGRLTVSTRPGDGGAFADVVSGPQAITFTTDGRYAFVVDANSEDVMVIEASKRAEAALVRPLPGHWPVGAVLSPQGTLYVAERNTEDLVAIDVSAAMARLRHASLESSLQVSVVRTIPSLSHDPMPPRYRAGQRIFNSANSDQLPITQNHWVACASCHIEQRTDAVTWRFLAGPRDTPSNAGGTLGTGFLFHTADRRDVADYWRTIDEEQGGEFSLNATQTPLLDELQAYVNHAIPLPIPPTTDPDLAAQGERVFNDIGCSYCHSGALRTDSGAGNQHLDLAGPEVTKEKPGGVLVHDVGTCNRGTYPDVAHTDMDGHARAACLFDTPSLRGLWDSAPYMHDGSAATLDDAVGIMLVAAAKAGARTEVSASERRALVEYLKSL